MSLFFRVILAGLVISFLLLSCKKEEPVLRGNASVSDFDFTISTSPGGDTLPFSNKVTFNNRSTGSFVWLWDFGDGTQSSLENPVHTFGSGTTFTVSLTSVGTAGKNKSTKVINLSSPCEFSAFQILTGCTNNNKWGLSSDPDAILLVNGSDSIPSPVRDCQKDDEYTFSASGAFNYESGGQTFDNGFCVAGKQNATSFYMLRNEGGFPKIVLKNGNGSRSFLGLSDSMRDNTFELLSVSENDFRVRSVRASDGVQVITKFFTKKLTETAIKLLLTGGSNKTWRLDSLSTAAITAGIEANPTTYYSGGPLAPCQKDDWYTFTADDNLTVNCNGSTLQPSEGYSCGGDNSFSSVYTFGPNNGSASGLAQISLMANNAGQWIGVLDRAPENVYRILEISGNRMKLRSGNGIGNGLVHTLIFVTK